MGGLVMARLRRIPREGDYIVELGFRFSVAEATERSLVKLRIEPDADVETAESIVVPEPCPLDEIESTKVVDNHSQTGNRKNGRKRKGKVRNTVAASGGEE